MVHKTASKVAGYKRPHQNKSPWKGFYFKVHIFSRGPGAEHGCFIFFPQDGEVEVEVCRNSPLLEGRVRFAHMLVAERVAGRSQSAP